MPIPPIPDDAVFTVTDLGGSSLGGGPHSMTSAKTIQAFVNGTVVDLGPYLVDSLKRQAIGSREIIFSVTCEPALSVVAGNWDWNSVDVAEYIWWCKVFDSGTASPLAFSYRAKSAAESTSNPTILVHIIQLPRMPNIPAQPDTPEEFTVEILGEYILIDDGTNTITDGVALA